MHGGQHESRPCCPGGLGPQPFAGNRPLSNRGAGRCQILQGDVSRLPFGDGSFDLATAFETVYFWPGPVESFREVYRTLQPGGIFLIVNESDGENSQDNKWLSVIDGMRIYNGDQLARFLTEAGFSKVIMDKDAKKHWLCALAIR